MKYDIRKNWGETLGFIKSNPIVIMPFAIIAFLELLSLEFIFFSTRFPLSHIANPIIRKFFGEAFIHYPGNIIALPRMFYYKQIAIYIVFGAFLTAMAVNVFKNIKDGLPVKAKAMIRNTLKSYASLFSYAVLITVLVLVLKKVDVFVFSKAVKIAVRVLPPSFNAIYGVCLTLLLFLTNLIMQTFFIATIPLIVLNRISLLKALARSITMGFRNFLTIFTLIFLPFFVYLPVIFLKSFSTQIVDKTFPEVNIFIIIIGAIATIFLDSFTILSVSRFLLDNAKNQTEKAE